MRARWLALILAGAAASSATGAAAEQSRDDEPRGGEHERAAEEHFEQALVHYSAGRYRSAIDSLRAALALDPNGKDLVYNLSLVHEKLGELDDAIVARRRYIELEKDPREIKRAESAILRMEGARAEVERPEPQVVRLMTPVPVRTPVSNERELDPWLLGGASVTAAAALVGIVFGVQAIAINPESPENGSTYWRRQKDRAETSALVSQIALSVSMVAGATSTIVWLVRAAPDDPKTVGLSWRGAF